MKKILCVALVFSMFFGLAGCTIKNKEEVAAEKAKVEADKATKEKAEKEEKEKKEQEEKAKKEEDSKLDLATNMTMLEKELDKKYTGYEISHDKKDWAIEETNGNIVVVTKIEMKTKDEKVPVTYIHSPLINDQYMNRYLRVGSVTVLDDGTIE